MAGEASVRPHRDAPAPRARLARTSTPFVVACLAALAACTGGRAAVPIVPADGPPGVTWTRDADLAATWRIAGDAGQALSVCARREDGGDVLYVQDSGLRPEDFPQGAGMDHAAGGVTIDVSIPGAEPGAEIGTFTESLGWHIVRHEVPVRAGDPVTAPAGYQRSFRLPAALAFGAPRLAPGTYRIDVTWADGTRRSAVPVAFRVSE